jgi:hypothetical protein
VVSITTSRVMSDLTSLDALVGDQELFGNGRRTLITCPRVVSRHQNTITDHQQLGHNQVHLSENYGRHHHQKFSQRNAVVPTSVGTLLGLLVPIQLVGAILDGILGSSAGWRRQDSYSDSYVFIVDATGRRRIRMTQLPSKLLLRLYRTVPRLPGKDKTVTAAERQ